jgi:hypothetical protein
MGGRCRPIALRFPAVVRHERAVTQDRTVAAAGPPVIGFATPIRGGVPGWGCQGALVATRIGSRHGAQTGRSAPSDRAPGFSEGGERLKKSSSASAMMMPAGPSHVAESVLVLVLGHLADEFGAVGAQASDGVVDAFDYKHERSGGPACSAVRSQV